MPDAGPDQVVCETPKDITLDGSSTVVNGCSLAPDYRWMEGDLVVRDWSVDPKVLVHPTETTLYTMQIRCGDCAGPCFDTDEVLVEFVADILPPDLGNTLLGIRSILDVVLSWTPVAEAFTYTVYRGIEKDQWQAPPILSGFPDFTVALPDVPGPPFLYYYRVAGASCSGREGP